MKKIPLLLMLALLCSSVIAQTNPECQQWKASPVMQLAKPAFSEKNNVDNKAYKESALLNSLQQANAKAILNWTELNLPADSVITAVNAKYQILQLSGFISTDRYTTTTLLLNTNGLFEVYLNGKLLKSQASASKKDVPIKMTLPTGKHQLLVTLLSLEDQLTFAAHFDSEDKTQADLQWSTNAIRGLTINDILDGSTVQNAQISPSGRYVLFNQNEILEGSGKRISSTMIYDLTRKNYLKVYRNSTLSGARWLPKSDQLSYLVKKEKTTDVYLLDMTTNTEKVIAQDIADLGWLTWSPNEDYIIFSRTEQAEKPGYLKRIFGNDDRLPYFRTRSYLYQLNLHNGLIRQLTSGYLSANLHDIKPDGSHILFSVSTRDYTVVPFSKQTLFEMNLATLEMDTIWKDKRYSGSCQYAPDGMHLLVDGSPETFGNLGVNVSNDHLPNSYDNQLYLFDLKTRQAKALTKDFDPSVGSVYFKNENEIYFTATDKEFVRLYKLDSKKNSFKAYDLPVDVISRISFSQQAAVAVLTGSGTTTPDKLYKVDLKSGLSELIVYPKEEALASVSYGNTESWNFVNKNGTSISGRVYYPTDYDASKKYPVIVYYYGGTTPTTRSFGGRYPKNIWAANGYIVYVLQPSGAIGFGQDFSALHVNGWGRDAIDDIIDGTKEFLATHPEADADNVGCIGASYGGFTTMMLQTRTDIFKTAISHAGISDISSYWGEGYWGYSYSAGATKNSYPWNRKDIYVENSPLFNADKFQNSILLLHGTADTNVPVGESLQYYAALKILGKNVEMVLIEGEDHHILDYQKRIQWHNTIMSWFDKMLKNQPEQWNEMYPEKNL